jgi:rod shape determining protein RodA
VDGVRRRFWGNLDWPLFALCLLAAGAGLVAIASASGSSLHDPVVHSYLKHQGGAILLGVVGMFVAAAIDYHTLAVWYRWLYAGTLLLLVAVLILGRHRYGAARWIPLGGFELQPSEFGKIALVVTLAAILAPLAGRVRSWRQAVVPTLLAVVPALLIAKEPDLGTSMIYAAALGGVLFAAGFSGVRLAIVGAAGVAAAVGLIVAHLRLHLPLPIASYQLNRLLSFVNPQADLQGSGWQVLQSELAVGSGRLVGTGLFSGGVNNQLHFLPESQTDFMFASIANFGGFIGAAGVLVLLGAIVVRILRCMAAAGDVLGGLIAGGVAAVLCFQTLLNAAVALGVVPVTGVPLPFFSYGGSSVVADFLAIGVVQSVHVRRRRLQF